MSTTRSVIETYCSSLDARDWATFGSVLAEDVRYELPQTGESVRGREAYVRFNREYPGDWHIRPARVVVEGAQAVVWNNFELDGEKQHGIGFFTVDGSGRVAHIVDFWPQPYDPPAGREHLVSGA
ncbi:MAG TPA: nuclear transport factor 2 family protein [Kribbellaceae bacterium]|nr:nuclear transport factor 2 family protein [Kribbellaceae bacterium]